MACRHGLLSTAVSAGWPQSLTQATDCALRQTRYAVAPGTRLKVIVTLPPAYVPATPEGAGSRPDREIFGPLLFESWLGPAGRFGGLTSLKCLQAGRPPAVAAFAWVRFTPVSTAAPTATARTLIQVRRRMRPLDHTHRRW